MSQVERTGETCTTCGAYNPVVGEACIRCTTFTQIFCGIKGVEDGVLKPFKLFPFEPQGRGRIIIDTASNTNREDHK